MNKEQQSKQGNVVIFYSYLFEAKSIQDYLFRSGRLKDTIAASDRLDRLVDESKDSLLYQVLEAAGLTSNLLESKKTDVDIYFTRCKGGGFYGLSANRDNLIKLRSCWTLTIQQVLPGLRFADGLGEGDSVQKALDNGRKVLTYNKQNPMVQMPIGTAAMKRTNRTGSPAIEQSIADGKEHEWDTDVDSHRQAYINWDLKQSGQLQQKFSSALIKEQALAFPVEPEDFWFYSDEKDLPKDIALIHLDGNGLGNLMATLQHNIVGLDGEKYMKVLRTFSNALARATQEAAKVATQWLSEKARYEKNGSVYIPMRPLVLGGDDITLFCHAEYALQYAEKFCNAFELLSEKYLSALHKQYLKSKTQVKGKLTASGGILYHKAGHAFSNCHRLVEELTKEAKSMTKKVDANVGPAAVAFFRLSSTATSSLAQLRERFEHFELDGTIVKLGLGCYLVRKGCYACIDDLHQCIEKVKVKGATMSLGKWRQMSSYLALGDVIEANRFYQRAVERSRGELPWAKAFNRISVGQLKDEQWYWMTDQGHYQSIITDLLLVAHFMPQSQEDDLHGVTA